MVRRLASRARAGKLALMLVGPVTAAVAGDRDDGRGSGRVAVTATLTCAEVAAVKAARQTYLETGVAGIGDL